MPDAPPGVVYIDTSALVKLVVREAESDALELALTDLGELCLIRSKRSGCASSIERAIAQVGSQSVLNYLGIALADGLDGVLADAADDLLVDQQVDPVPRHDSKVPGALLRRSARAGHSVRTPSFRRPSDRHPSARGC